MGHGFNMAEVTMKTSPGYIPREIAASEEMFKFLCKAAKVEQTGVIGIACRVRCGTITFEIERRGEAEPALAAIAEASTAFNEWLDQNTFTTVVKER
jgi:hypothetical protein